MILPRLLSHTRYPSNLPTASCSTRAASTSPICAAVSWTLSRAATSSALVPRCPNPSGPPDEAETGSCLSMYTVTPRSGGTVAAAGFESPEGGAETPETSSNGDEPSPEPRRSSLFAAAGSPWPAFKIFGPRGRPSSNLGGATSSEEAGFVIGGVEGQEGAAGAWLARGEAGPSEATTSGLGAPGASPGAPAASPRLALLASLLEAVRTAAAAGDMEAARIAHEAAGKLLSARP